MHFLVSNRVIPEPNHYESNTNNNCDESQHWFVSSDPINSKLKQMLEIVWINALLKFHAMIGQLCYSYIIARFVIWVMAMMEMMEMMAMMAMMLAMVGIDKMSTTLQLNIYNYIVNEILPRR